MTNILNTTIANQSVKTTGEKEQVIFNAAKNTVKPMPHKGELLPSRIFGSPIEYVKDLKQDIVNIKRASTGKANDHELGRINDVAMKMGSLCLAAYLFVKNPVKLNKAMEFIGFGTFFAGMALWPKIAIQAPLKARTGVDIHQKYIDSQGRKKMMFQDPQYDLTNLYAKDDLKRIGRKLNVDESLPDRDNFIKQRAKKTAVQGNTLWMMTAGFASPLISALACNRLEEPVANLIEKFNLKTSATQLNNFNRNNAPGFISKIKQTLLNRNFNKFLANNANQKLDTNCIDQLTSIIGKNINDADIKSGITKEIAALKNNVKIDKDFILKALQGKIPDNILETLSEEQLNTLNQAMSNGSIDGISRILTNASYTGSSQKAKMALEVSMNKSLEAAKAAMEQPTVAQVKDKLLSLYNNMTNFSIGNQVIDKYITARVGNQSGTYIARQWERTGKKLMKLLNLNMKELKALSLGDESVLNNKLTHLATNNEKYSKAITELMKLIDDYEYQLSPEFKTNIQKTTNNIYTSASTKLQRDGFTNLAKNFTDNINVNSLKAEQRMSGARSSIYRLIQTIDFYKQDQNHSVQSNLEGVIKEINERKGNYGTGYSNSFSSVTELVQKCKKILLNATSSDHAEKLTSSGYKLNSAEYEACMKTLYNTSSNSANNLMEQINHPMAERMINGFNNYKNQFAERVVNWKNEITPELARRHLHNGIKPTKDISDAVERNNLIGKPTMSLIQDIAKQTYNSRKWLHIFGGALAVLTAVTLTATLFMGRKNNTEKQAELESKQKNV